MPWPMFAPAYLNGDQVHARVNTKYAAEQLWLLPLLHRYYCKSHIETEKQQAVYCAATTPYSR
jgi:hypothetical protein